jgi:hypothetical protein
VEEVGALQLRSTECATAATPVALKVSAEVVPSVELLVKTTWPLIAPAALGRNWIVTVAVAPALNVSGRLLPVMENPVPVTEAADTVTGEVPVEDSVTDSVVEDPTVTLPKLRLAVLSTSLGLATAVPVPVRVTTEELPVVELLTIVSCPVTAPATVGANSICSVNDCPAGKDSGMLLTTVVNPVPVRVAELMLRADVPEEVTVSESVFVFPSVTLPKLRLFALSVSLGAAAAVPVPESATTVVAPVVELLLIVNCPVSAPAVLGAKVIGIASV